MGLIRALGVLFASLALIGCSAELVNPSFNISREAAGDALDDMAHSPRSADRPIVVIGGYGDLGVGAAIAAGNVRRWFEPDAVVIPVSPGWAKSFDTARDQVIAAVHERLGTPAGSDTPEVDVVGLSMGGVVARYAASDLPDRPRLNARRIFTIASPHQGSKRAEWAWAVETKISDLRPESAFLTALAGQDASARYDLYCYTRLDDSVVGEALAAPPGRVAWWVSNPPGGAPHIGALVDDRILADIARRLRGETPLASLPPAPLPVR
jgi:pimeloyl-ACP methyl ester carboxylesterase